jgi:hypothetical protein
MLARVPAYKRLHADGRRRLRDSLADMAAHATVGVADVVDFPAFVAGLIKGVFEAIVNVSIEQMEAYADLLDDVARSLDEFAPKRRGSASSRDRQRLLATMVLMGINRIVVTKGKIVARSVLRRDDDDEDDDQGA